MAYVVGLTGGIGSGKTAVAAVFAAHGIEVTDTDELAHALSAPGQAGYDGIVAAFGRDYLRADGTLDRGKLRERVFADNDAKTTLEQILHPLIRAAALAAVARWRSPYGLLVVPLLLERGGLTGVVDRILVVDCPAETQRLRVIARSGLTDAAVRAIMATQLPRAERLARADDVLDNAGLPQAIGGQVAALDRRYRALAAASLSAAGHS